MWIRIRAVIIEDEPLAAQYLAALLDDTCQVECRQRHRERVRTTPLRGVAAGRRLSGHQSAG